MSVAQSCFNLFRCWALCRYVAQGQAGLADYVKGKCMPSLFVEQQPGFLCVKLTWHTFVLKVAGEVPNKMYCAWLRLKYRPMKKQTPAAFRKIFLEN